MRVHVDALRPGCWFTFEGFDCEPPRVFVRLYQNSEGPWVVAFREYSQDREPPSQCALVYPGQPVHVVPPEAAQPNMLEASC